MLFLLLHQFFGIYFISVESVSHFHLASFNDLPSLNLRYSPEQLCLVSILLLITWILCIDSATDQSFHLDAPLDLASEGLDATEIIYLSVFSACYLYCLLQ